MVYIDYLKLRLEKGVYVIFITRLVVRSSLTFAQSHPTSVQPQFRLVMTSFRPRPTSSDPMSISVQPVVQPHPQDDPSLIRNLTSFDLSTTPVRPHSTSIQPRP